MRPDCLLLNFIISLLPVNTPAWKRSLTIHLALPLSCFVIVYIFALREKNAFTKN